MFAALHHHHILITLSSHPSVSFGFQIFAKFKSLESHICMYVYIRFHSLACMHTGQRCTTRHDCVYIHCTLHIYTHTHAYTHTCMAQPERRKQDLSTCALAAAAAAARALLASFFAAAAPSSSAAQARKMSLCVCVLQPPCRVASREGIHIHIHTHTHSEERRRRVEERGGGGNHGNVYTHTVC